MRCHLGRSPALLFAFGLVAAGQEPSRISTDARWTPATADLQAVRAACAPRQGAADTACVLDQFAQRGAPAAAVEFSRRVAQAGGDAAFLRAIRETGRVSVAYVAYPLRATDTHGCWLVNGIPDLVDVDAPAHVPRTLLDRDPIYAALARRFGDVTLSPGDRTDAGDPVAALTVDGGQRFTVSYRLRHGCRSCDVIGVARIAFDFDDHGVLDGTALVSVSDRVAGTGAPHAAAPPIDDPGRTLQVQVAETFTITLDADHDTGHEWRLTTPLGAGVLALIDRHYATTPGTRLGQSGREVWTFKALAPGRAELPFAYARATGPPTRTTTYIVVVR
jgi:inhibitor of cysteine peptidase